MVPVFRINVMNWRLRIFACCLCLSKPTAFSPWKMSRNGGDAKQKDDLQLYCNNSMLG